MHESVLSKSFVPLLYVYNSHTLVYTLRQYRCSYTRPTTRETGNEQKRKRKKKKQKRLQQKRHTLSRWDMPRKSPSVFCANRLTFPPRLGNRRSRREDKIRRLYLLSLYLAPRAPVHTIKTTAIVRALFFLVPSDRAPHPHSRRASRINI